MPDNGRTFYFGRGGSNCLGVELRPGEYFRLFIGNGKNPEPHTSALFDRAELYRLAEFFRLLWKQYGAPHDADTAIPLDMSMYESESPDAR